MVSQPPSGKPAQPQPVQVPQGMRMPTQQELEQMRARIAADAAKAGMSVPEFIEHVRKQQQQLQARAGGGPPQAAAAAAPSGAPPAGHAGHVHTHGPQGQQQQHAVPPGGPPNPRAIAVAQFLRSQNLKLRTVILNGQRRDMFRVKRAIRALQSDAYKKAQQKKPDLLPIIPNGDRAAAENTLKMLPLSMLALRVGKVEQAQAQSKKQKRTKGQWTVQIERAQECDDSMYYCWLWEGSQLKAKLYAALALAVIFVIVLYPLWPEFLRRGVYYITWGLLGMLGAFFVMSIFRVILFCATYFVIPPGLWLYPNLWEDVGFLDSFKPAWAWHETAKKKKKRSRSITGGSMEAQSALNATTGQPAAATATTTATDTIIATGEAQKRAYAAPRVEELLDDE